MTSPSLSEYECCCHVQYGQKALQGDISICQSISITNNKFIKIKHLEHLTAFTAAPQSHPWKSVWDES